MDINMKLCRIQKNGVDDLISKEEIDTDVENKYMDTKWGKEGVG